MPQKKIITFSLSWILLIMLWFVLAYIVFDIRLINFKKDIIQAVKSNSIVGLWESSNQDLLWDFEKKITKNIQNTKQSVVHIIGTQTIGWYLNGSGTLLNSGVIQNPKIEIWWWNWIIISEDWFIITNKYIIQQPNVEYKIIDFWWNIYKLDKIWSDNNSDFAIIKIKDQNWNNAKDMTPTNIISAKDKVQIGQWIFAIWNTSSDNINWVTMWIVSAKNIKIQWNKLIWFYKTDASLSLLNSWWPIINTNWEVIWISAAKNTFAQSTSYILPITKELINRIFSSIQNNWKITYPSFWFNFIEINTINKNELKLDTNNWILVTEIINDSEAYSKWIKIWDIIIWINGNEINNDNPFLYQLFWYKSWDKVVLNIQRWSKKLDIDVFLGENSQ
jgi:S1-C subfamily serine protease